MPPLAPESRPALAAHARLRDDPITGHRLLLYPEGALELDDTAAAILDLCDGRRTIAAIARELATRFDGDPAQIALDTLDCLDHLKKLGFLATQDTP